MPSVKLTSEITLRDETGALMGSAKWLNLLLAQEDTVLAVSHSKKGNPGIWLQATVRIGDKEEKRSSCMAWKFVDWQNESRFDHWPLEESFADNSQDELLGVRLTAGARKIALLLAKKCLSVLKYKLKKCDGGRQPVVNSVKLMVR